MSLEGRVALITGASRGIGRECARNLAEAGVCVAIGYRSDRESAEETAKQLPQSRAIEIDVRSAESVESAFDSAERELGPVAILINNAGVTRDKPLMRMAPEEWDEVIDTTLGGAYRCTKRALPAMLREGWGRIVSIGSVAGTMGNPGQANYSAAKAGLVGFTKSLAREVGRYGITANVVAPGLVDTTMTEPLPEKARKVLLDRTPLGRAARPEEIAAAVRLCIDSEYMTGSTIQVDGGIS